MYLRFITLLATALLVSACAQTRLVGSTAQQRDYTPAQDLLITPKEMIALRSAAVSGDLSAVKRIAMYYSFAKFDEVAAFGWWQVGAILRDPICAQNVKVIGERWRKARADHSMRP